jgi:hypothetical protein
MGEGRFSCSGQDLLDSFLTLLHSQALQVIVQ